MKLYASQCTHPYSSDFEDTTSYGPGWEDDVNNTKLSANEFSPLDQAFVYASQTQVNGTEFWGKLAVYSGGGYIANLGKTHKSAMSVLEELESAKWVDQYTRAVFLELNVWNPNTNLFSLVVISFEFPSIGGAMMWTNIKTVQLYRYMGPGGLVNLASEILVTLYMVVLTVMTIKEMVKQKCAYWTNGWNVLLVLTLVLFYTSLGTYIMRCLWTIKAVELVLNNPGEAPFQQASCFRGS